MNNCIDFPDANEFKWKNRYINFYQLEIFAIKAAKQR